MEWKKWTTRILYAVGITIFIIAILTVTISSLMDDKTVRIVGIVLSFVAFITIMVAFSIDFFEVMVISDTAGDEFTLMSKERLIALLDEAGIEYELGKGREYYLYLVREHRKID